MRLRLFSNFINTFIEAFYIGHEDMSLLKIKDSNQKYVSLFFRKIYQIAGSFVRESSFHVDYIEIRIQILLHTELLMIKNSYIN